MSLPAPKIDERSYDDLVTTTEALLYRYSEWEAGNEEDGFGRALVRIFAHFSHLVVDRLNRLPDKNFLAFLELTGVELLAPRPARVPLTFELTEGASDLDAIVGARTSVAATPTDAEKEIDADPVVFETERSVYLTRSRLVSAWTLDPASMSNGERTTFCDQSAIATGDKIYDVLYAFGASGAADEDQRIWRERSRTSENFDLFLGHVELIGLSATKTIELRLHLEESVPEELNADTFKKWLDARQEWLEQRLRQSQWQAWDGADWGSILVLGDLDEGEDEDQKRSVTSVLPIGELPEAVKWQWKVKLLEVGAVPISKIQSRENAWIRGRLARAGRHGPFSLQPIQLNEVDVLVRDAVRDASTSDMVFANQAQIDPTKDFLPFGDRPKAGDTLYVASEQLFSKPGALVTVDIEVTSPRNANGGEPPPAEPSKDLQLIWEYWSAKSQKWRALPLKVDEPDGTADGTQRFTVSGQVSFRAPSDLGQLEVNGEIRRWIRVRIVRGDYGVETRFEFKTDENGEIIRENGIPIFVQVPAKARPIRPPSIKSFDLKYAEYGSARLPVDNVLAEHDFVYDDIEAARQELREFRPFETDMVPTFYLGFQRERAEIGFSNQPISLFFRVAGPSDTVSPQTPLLLWEYWSGTDWATLDIQDETDGLRQSGLIVFIGPTDFRPTSRFAKRPQTFWLRIRWEMGQYQSPPKLRRVLTNTIWATHLETIENEILGPGTGQPHQVVQTTRVPVLGDLRIEVRELASVDAPPPPDTTAPSEPRVVPPPRAEQWMPWNRVDDFVNSSPGSRHYILDRRTGQIRFADGRRGMIPPRGADNIRASQYRTGGGKRGNRQSNTITQLLTTIPYVGGATNLEASSGGADGEDLDSVKQRGPRTLKHRDRAVAASDFEDLALEVVGVARAKSVASLDSSGRVKVILVAQSDDARPFPSSDLMGQVKRHLIRRMPPAVDLSVVGPNWLPIEVEVTLVPESLDEVHQLKSELSARLTAFLHPLTGGPNNSGWPFGQTPRNSDLFSIAERTIGVREVRKVKQKPTVEMPKGSFLIVSADQHKIEIRLPD